MSTLWVGNLEKKREKDECTVSLVKIEWSWIYFEGSIGKTHGSPVIYVATHYRLSQCDGVDEEERDDYFDRMVSKLSDKLKGPVSTHMDAVFKDGFQRDERTDDLIIMEKNVHSH